MKHLILAASLAMMSSATLAQPALLGGPATTGSINGPIVTNPGGPGIATSGPASTGEISVSGTGADRISNNAAGDGNAERQTLGDPNVGRSGNGMAGGSN